MKVTSIMLCSYSGKIAISSEDEILKDAWLRDRSIIPLRDIKTKITLDDGSAIEASIFELLECGRKEVHTCISTQAGCRFGCRFCSSGLNGFRRDLSADEIIREVELLSGVAEIGKFNHVSFMGIGEPLDNFENVVIAIRRLVETDPWYVGRISLATVGLLPQMYQLARLRLPLKMLWVSLHTVDDDKRRQIMPIGNLYGVKKTVDVAIDFMEMTGIKTWINYMVMPYFNDSIEDAERLTSLLSGRGSGLSVMVTLPNPGTIGCGQGGVDDVSRFIEKLSSCGMKNRITRFFAAGRPIKAGCGEFLFHPGSTK